MLKAYVKIRKKKKKDEKRKALIFAVLFATLTFVSVGCARGTTQPEEEWNKTFGVNSENPLINNTSS